MIEGCNESLIEAQNYTNEEIEKLRVEKKELSKMLNNFKVSTSTKLLKFE